MQTGIVRVFGVVSSSAPKTAYIKILKFVLLTVLAMSGAVICIRALLGPFTFPRKATSPVNPEGWFGLALVLTMLVVPDAAETTVPRTAATI